MLGNKTRTRQGAKKTHTRSGEHDEERRGAHRIWCQSVLGFFSSFQHVILMVYRRLLFLFDHCILDSSKRVVIISCDIKRENNQHTPCKLK